MWCLLRQLGFIVAEGGERLSCTPVSLIHAIQAARSAAGFKNYRLLRPVCLWIHT